MICKSPSKCRYGSGKQKGKKVSEQPDDVDQALAAEDVAFQGPQHVALVQYLALVPLPEPAAPRTGAYHHPHGDAGSR